MSAPAGLSRRRAPGPGGGEPRVGAALAAIVLMAINLRTIIAGLPPLLSEVRADLGLSATVAGLLTTLPVVCFGALAPLVPRLAHRVTLERMIVACGAVTAVAASLRAVGGVAGLFAGSLLAGAAVGVAQSALPALIRARHAAHTGLLTGGFSMALPAGATIASAAAVPLETALGGSWQAALAVWSLPAVLATAVWLPAALGTGTLVGGRAPAPLRAEALAWCVATFFGIQSTAFYAGLAWLPSILESFGRSSAAAGALQALNALVSAVPAFLVPLLAARRERQTAILAVIVPVAAAGVAGLLVLPGGAVAWMVLIGLGQGGSLGLALILPVLRAGSTQVAASLTAMTLCVGYLVGATGPWVLGAAHDLSGGWDVPLAVMLAITLAQLLPGSVAARGGVVAGPGRYA